MVPPQTKPIRKAQSCTAFQQLPLRSVHHAPMLPQCLQELLAWLLQSLNLSSASKVEELRAHGELGGLLQDRCVESKRRALRRLGGWSLRAPLLRWRLLELPLSVCAFRWRLGTRLHSTWTHTEVACLLCLQGCSPLCENRLPLFAVRPSIVLLHLLLIQIVVHLLFFLTHFAPCLVALRDAEAALLQEDSASIPRLAAGLRQVMES